MSSNPTRGGCIRYIMWSSLSVTCDRSVVFSTNKTELLLKVALNTITPIRLYHISNVVFYRKKGCFTCTVQWKYKKNYIATIYEYSFCYEIILKFKHLQVMRKFCLNILPFLFSSARQSNILLDIHVLWFPLSIRNHQNSNTTKILKASYILLKHMLLTNYSTLLHSHLNLKKTNKTHNYTYVICYYLTDNWTLMHWNLLLAEGLKVLHRLFF